MRPLLFARFSPLRDTYSIEALYANDLGAIEEILHESGIYYTMGTGKVGENYLLVPVDQHDVDKDIWARTIVDNCNLIEIPEDINIYGLQADAMGNVIDYEERKKRPHWVTLRDYAAMVVLYRALESCTNRWSERNPTDFLLDLLDEELSTHPRIAFRAFQQLQDLLQNY